MDDEIQENGSYSKPGYDSRLYFSKSLMIGIEKIKLFETAKNYESWYLEIKSLAKWAMPFWRPANKSPFLVQLGLVRNEIYKPVKKSNLVEKHHNLRLSSMLDDLTFVFAENSKHLLLPISDEDDDHFDEAKFLREVDL